MSAQCFSVPVFSSYSEGQINRFRMLIKSLEESRPHRISNLGVSKGKRQSCACVLTERHAMMAYWGVEI